MSNWEKPKWLGYRLSAEAIKPIEEKVQAITDELEPKNLKDLRSFMEAINQMNQFLPNLANVCAPLRPLLKKDNEGKWEKDNVVLGLDGNGTPPIVLKGRIDKQSFVAMIDSESPITIFTTEDLRKLLNTDVTFVRPLLKTEEYLDYNGRTLTF